MLTEKEKSNDYGSLYDNIKNAKLDYDNAVNRFNTAQTDRMTELAIMDMNAAMKRYSVIVEQAREMNIDGFEL